MGLQRECTRILGITRSPLVRDARTKEELAHGVLKGQNDRLDISVMDAKAPPDADVTGLLQAWPGGELTRGTAWRPSCGASA